MAIRDEKTANYAHKPRSIDLGCGSKKTPGAFGIDHFPYPGVDIIFDLNQIPWPLGDSRFETVYAHHVIEHVNSIPCFLSELHRISSDQAEVHIVTPHFSSLDSWKDPTHRWHLSMEWHAPFCDSNRYLADQLPKFEVLSSNVKFSSSLRSVMPKILCKLFGLHTWEKHYAFKYPAKNILTRLRVNKRVQ